jgi:uncharacterized RDD family membrane protein YckC
MSVCRNCGHQNDENENRCSQCGAKLNVVSLHEWRGKRPEKPKANLGKRPVGRGGLEKLPDNYLLLSKKASFLSRAVATIVDFVVLFIPAFLMNFILPVFGLIVTIAVYNIGLTTMRGQTLGKVVMGIKVISTDGTPMTLEKSSIRFLGFLISCLTLGIGFLMALGDKNNQSFHDKFAGTYVVQMDMPTSSLPTRQEEKGK